MSYHNESSIGNKYFFEIEWGLPKKIYLNKFYFGREFFNIVEINGQIPSPENPVFIYPEDRNNMQANPAVIVLKEFYESGSILPKCSIKAEVTIKNRIEIITSYQFQNVRILERYGKNGDRFQWFYKFRFGNWS